MELMPAEIGLIPVIVAVLLGPLFVKKIEHNLEAFLFLTGAFAVVLSRSWHIGFVEDAVQEPIVIGMVLSVLVAGWIVNYYRPHFLQRVNEILSDGITMRVIFLEIVVVLGLSAAIITPILPFFAMVEVVNHLPLQRRDRANLLILAGLSIILGSAMALAQAPYSTMAITKLQGALPSASSLPLELQSLYLPCILVLGMISVLFAGEKVNALEMQAQEGRAALKSAAIWSARVCMFAGALILVGVAFGANF